MAAKPDLQIASDASTEDWQDFLRQVEARCEEVAEDPKGAGERPRQDDPWATESGDPIDPLAFFVTFTGIE